MNSPDPRINYFDAQAGNWDEEGPTSQDMTARLEQHSTLLKLAPGQRLLEAGCGTGKISAWLARQVAPGKVTAVDFAPAMIGRAKEKGIDAEFVCLDLCRDALGESRFDVVFCFHCFPHLRDQQGALNNLALALKPGGRVIIMHLAGSEHINHFHANLDGPVRGDALPQGEQWTAFLDGAGLRQVKLIDREDLFFLEAKRLEVETKPNI